MTLTETRDAALAAQASALEALNAAQAALAKTNDDVVAAVQALNAVQPSLDILAQIEVALTVIPGTVTTAEDEAVDRFRASLAPAVAQLRALFNV